MEKRAFFVRLNLDDMGASLDSLDSTEERGLWLEGFRIGSRGNPSRDGWAEPKKLGHEFGMECWNSAQAFREKQSAKGKASANSRNGSTTVQPQFNHSSTEPPTGGQPEVNLSRSQKPEARSEEREAKNDQLEAIYSAYPRKQAKADALKAISKALRKIGFSELLEAVNAYYAAVATWPESERQYVPYAATWFNGGRWADDREMWKPKHNNVTQRKGMQFTGFSETDYNAGVEEYNHRGSENG